MRRMSTDTSPLHYGALEDPFITDANFKVEINQKMKVPNKISFEGHNGIKSNTWSGPSPSEAIDMQVPERILVVGQNQHLGKNTKLLQFWFFTSFFF